MNVKSDNKIYKYNTDLTSLEVIYLINKNNKITKYGVFDINSHKEKKPKDYVFDNEIDKFVNEFYDEYDFNIKTQRYTKGYFNRKEWAIKNTNLYLKLMDNKLIFINDYSIKSLDNEKAFKFFRNYYFFLFLNYLKGKNIWNKYMEYFNLLDELNAENYGNYTKIRIITDFIQNILLYELIPTFMNINTLDKNDPYRLAIEFQKQIISNIKETSNIFYPIIQFNSKILKILPDNIWDIFKNKIKSLFHKIIKEEYAYTISLEDLTDMRSHLLSLQEDFFFIFSERNNIELLGKFSNSTKITTINQYLLCNNLYSLVDLKSSEDNAFSINLVFCHERMSHAKEHSSNPANKSPCIHFNKDFQKDLIFEDSNLYYLGESGRMLESFISNKCLIKFMKIEKIFGNYLDIKYFIGDFKEINDYAISEFKKSNLYSKARNKVIYNLLFAVVLFISIIYFLVRIYGIKKSNNKFLIIILIFLLFLFIGFIKKNYNKYYEPYKYNELFYKTDMNNIEEEKEIRLIYPDDYPFESETFLGRYFPFLQFKEKKIRKKLEKYINLLEN